MRNSTTHPLYVSWIELEGDEGALGLTLCPGKYQPVASTGSWDRQLDVDVQALVDMGVSHVISLITDDDMRVLRVEDLPQQLQNNGFIMLPPSLCLHHLTHGCVDGHGKPRLAEDLDHRSRRRKGGGALHGGLEPCGDLCLVVPLVTGHEHARGHPCGS